jgi:phosphotriesterase-related protein
MDASRNGVAVNLETKQMVQTVLGLIPADVLGVTLPHEHLLTSGKLELGISTNYAPPPNVSAEHPSQLPITLETRGWLEYHWEQNRDNLVLDDEATAIAEAMRYRRAGGTTIVDVTPIGHRPNPRVLAAIAEAADLNIVMGTGYYVAEAHPESVRDMSQEDITSLILDEFAHGADGTGIKPGVIGEIGCSWPLLDEERKSLRAAAVAQRELEAPPLYIHPGKNPDAPAEIVAILEDEGVNMSRVVMCHIERTVQNDSSLLELAQTGCFVEYDQFGWETTGSYYMEWGITMPSDSQRIEQIMMLSDRGHGEQILISHDVCYKHNLSKYGGPGYDHILTHAIPLMKTHGMTHDGIEKLIIQNPRRALTG